LDGVYGRSLEHGNDFIHSFDLLTRRSTRGSPHRPHANHPLTRLESRWAIRSGITNTYDFEVAGRTLQVQKRRSVPERRH
jgi:hypothetical protein